MINPSTINFIDVLDSVKITSLQNTSTIKEEPKKHHIKSKISACSHEVELFDTKTRTKIVKTLLKILKPRIEEFDAIAISGYSMAMISPILADKLKKNIVLVRKPSEDRISSYRAEGIHYQRCIIIDDLICSGFTFIRIIDGLKEIHCTTIGFVLYNDSMTRHQYKDIPCWGKIK